MHFAKAWQEVVLQQADIRVPRPLIGLDEGYVLILDEGGEGRHSTLGGPVLGRVLAHGDLVAGLFCQMTGLGQGHIPGNFKFTLILKLLDLNFRWAQWIRSSFGSRVAQEWCVGFQPEEAT